MNKLIYIAGPYTHESAVVRHERFEALTHFAAELMAQGEIVFSPITHGHPMAQRVELPTAWEYWEQHCQTFLRASAKVIVLCLPGWRESRGVTAEIMYATYLGLPIEYVRVEENAELTNHDRKVGGAARN